MQNPDYIHANGIPNYYTGNQNRIDLKFLQRDDKELVFTGLKFVIDINSLGMIIPVSHL